MGCTGKGSLSRPWRSPANLFFATVSKYTDSLNTPQPPNSPSGATKTDQLTGGGDLFRLRECAEQQSQARMLVFIVNTRALRPSL